MFVIALCTACFFRVKINKKNFGSLLLDLASYFECSGAGTAQSIVQHLVQTKKTTTTDMGTDMQYDNQYTILSSQIY